MFKDLRLVTAQLRFNRLRYLLMVLSTGIAFLVFGVLGTLDYSLGSGETSVSEGRLMVTHHQGLMQNLPLAYEQQLKGVTGVQSVSHGTWWGSYYQDQSNMFIALAVDPASWLDQHPDMIVTPEAREAFLSQRNGMLVSKALARKYSWSVGDLVPFQSILYPPPGADPAWDYRISGTFESTDSAGGRNFIITHYRYLNENRTFWQDTVGTFVVTPTSGTSSLVLAQRIDATFANADAPTSTTTDKAFHNEFFAQFGDVRRILFFVIGTTFAALMLIVTSGLALSVRQRSREIGLLRVLGFSAGRIYGLILLETAAVIAAGASVGLLCALAFNQSVTGALPQFLPDLSLPTAVIGQAALIAIFLTVAGAVAPAVIALSVQPRQAFVLEDG